MAYVIAEPCIDNMDQSCVSVCPVDCIAADLEVDRKFYIDCGACEQACPNQAIFPSDRLPAEWAGFEWVDATWYTDPGAARGAIDTQIPAPIA
jgi:NAD-dependent dihydropyrimidine dehydrogenase PreA subunit